MPGASVFGLPLASLVWCYLLEIRPDSGAFLAAFEPEVDLTAQVRDHLIIMAGNWVCSSSSDTGEKSEFRGVSHIVVKCLKPGERGACNSRPDFFFFFVVLSSITV